jgi:hypothetical protein
MTFKAAFTVQGPMLWFWKYFWKKNGNNTFDPKMQYFRCSK